MMNSTEWRSQDANSEFGLDDSIASTINSSFLSSNTQKDENSSFTSEEGLLNALNNLSLESAGKPRRSSRSDPNLDSSYEDCQDLSSNTQIDLSINNTVIHDPSHSAEADKKLTDDQTSENLEVTQNNYIAETDTPKKDISCSQVIDTPTNEHQECVSESQTTSDNTGEQKNTTQDVKNDIPINSDSKSIPDVDQKNMNVNINKSAVLNQSTKKSKPASPSLLPKPKPRNIDSSLDQSVSKVTKPAAKHVVKTITDASDGVHLKEEKINHFGIPVISGRKKHIEAQPFNFLARGKSTSIASKTSDKVANKTLNATGSKVMNKTISGVTDKTMNKTLRSASDKLVNKTLTAKRISNVPSRVMDKTIKRPSVLNTTKSLQVTKSLGNAKISTKVNQENKTPNVIPKSKTQVAPKPSGISGPPKLHTDKRAKERHEFDVQIRQKQLEIDRLRMMWEEKQREKEKLEELALRRTMEPKAHPMPEFKAPVPIKSSKALTVPQSPATWAHNHKK